MTGRRALLPVLLLAATALVGCSDDEPTGGDAPGAAPSPENAEACELLTEAEVSEAVGSPVGPGRGTSGPVATGGSQSTCEWFSVDRPADTAKLTIYSETSAADSVKDSDPNAEQLRGVGDDAFIGPFASVWVYQGDRSFMAQWYSMMTDDEENLPKSEALARLVAERL